MEGRRVQRWRGGAVRGEAWSSEGWRGGAVRGGGVKQEGWRRER